MEKDIIVVCADRAVGSCWKLALLWHCWSRDLWPWWLTWGPGLWAGRVKSKGAEQDM